METEPNKWVSFRIEQCQYGGFVMRADDGDLLKAFENLEQVTAYLKAAMRSCFDEDYPDRKMASRFAPDAPAMRLPEPGDEFYDDRTEEPQAHGMFKRALRAVAGGKS